MAKKIPNPRPSRKKRAVSPRGAAVAPLAPPPLIDPVGAAGVPVHFEQDATLKFIGDSPGF